MSSANCFCQSLTPMAVFAMMIATSLFSIMVVLYYVRLDVGVYMVHHQELRIGNSPMVTQLIKIDVPTQDVNTQKTFPGQQETFPGQPLDMKIHTYLTDHCNRVDTRPDIYRTQNNPGEPLCDCVNQLSVGRIVPSMEARPFNVSQLELPEVLPGGSWSPQACRSRQHVAIIIPYRNRLRQLQILVPRLHTVLQTQMLNYTIFVSEQRFPNDNNHTHSFNKAMMMNIAFLEASQMSDYDCFIFHDVDFIPEDDRSMYMCRERPLHLGAYHDSHHYRIKYAIFGAVTVFTKSQFLDVNGFSNRFFGWGGEDDEMMFRVGKKIRNSVNISRYVTVPHNSSHKKGYSHKRKVIRLLRHRTPKTDGLNSIAPLYNAVRINKLPLYTWINSDVYTEEQAADRDITE